MSAECILNVYIRSAEDSRGPQPKIQLESSNEVSSVSNARRQKSSVFAVHLRTVGPSFPEGLVLPWALPCDHTS